jgi:hypothetical protein
MVNGGRPSVMTVFLFGLSAIAFRNFLLYYWRAVALA